MCLCMDSYVEVNKRLYSNKTCLYYTHYTINVTHYTMSSRIQVRVYSSVRKREAFATRDCCRHVLMVGLHVAWDGPGQSGEVVVDGVDDSSHVGPFVET